MCGNKRIFTPEIETDSVDHMLELEDNCNRPEITHVTHYIEDVNNMTTNFYTTPKKAVTSWAYAFMQRHPEISAARAEKCSVNYFDLKLKSLVVQHKITADTIWTMDGSGFKVVRKKCVQVYVSQRLKPGMARKYGKGMDTTIVCCCNAKGRTVPPMIILQGNQISPDMVVPEATLLASSEMGLLTPDLFYKWLEHFVAHVQPTLRTKVLLVLDSHLTHKLNFTALQFAKQHGVILVSLPAHRFQPLDVGVFKSMGTHVVSGAVEWLEENPDQIILPDEKIGVLLTVAYTAASCNRQLIEDAFEACGMWPLDFEKFINGAVEMQRRQKKVSATSQADTETYQEFQSEPNDGEASWHALKNLKKEDDLIPILSQECVAKKDAIVVKTEDDIEIKTEVGQE
jgi:DDE superfamily endonuclease